VTNSRRSTITGARLAAMIEEATVDCYNEEEQATGLFTMLEEYLAVPFETRVLGVIVIVTGVDLTGSDQIVATCRRDGLKQAIPILDLPLPTPPPDGAEWIEAYRRWRGLAPPRAPERRQPGKSESAHREGRRVSLTGDDSLVRARISHHADAISPPAVDGDRLTLAPSSAVPGPCGDAPPGACAARTAGSRIWRSSDQCACDSPLSGSSQTVESPTPRGFDRRGWRLR
jgi:hypothetical protein